MKGLATRRFGGPLALLVLVAAVVAVALVTRGGGTPGSDEAHYADRANGRLPAVALGARDVAASSAELRKLLGSDAKARAGEGRVRTLRGRIDDAVDRLKAQLGRDRNRLRDLGAGEALARVDRIERRTKAARAALDTALRSGSARDARRALDRLSPEPVEPTLSSDQLPLKVGNANPGAPSLGAAIVAGYQPPNAAVESSSLPREPSDDDRAEAPEGALTGAIEAKAEELDGDPIRIYNWVRKEIRYEPYYGIRKGAAGTLAEGGGNDADQAALLIALFRAADIPARYVHGTARLPIDQAANWLGLDTGAGDAARVAPDILASAGVPARGIAYNGTVRFVDFDHVWVEAHVAQSAYRGIEEAGGEKGWAPLDPSVKRNSFTHPVIDENQLVGPIARDLQDDIAAGFHPATDHSATLAPPEQVRPNFESAIGDAAATLEQRAGGDVTVGDAIGSHSTAREELGYLPASLPFTEREVDAEWRALPSNLVATVRVELAGADPDPGRATRTSAESSMSYSAPTWDLVGKRLTLAYAPATDLDAEVIDAYHGLLSTPAYAAQLMPVLRLDSHVVARGEPVAAAWFQGLTVAYDEPGQPAAVTRNPAQAGAISAIAVDPGSVSRDRVRANAARLTDLGPGTTGENAMTDARTGTLLGAIGDLYFARNDGMNRMLAQAAGVQQQRQLSGAIAATALRTNYIVSLPVAIGFAGLSLDVDEDVQSVVANDGDEDRVREYMAQSGVHASYSEGHGFSGTLGGSAASTAHVFQEAATKGIPFQVITAANVDEALGAVNASRAVEGEIRKEVALGRVATIPRGPVRLGDFHGTGYTIEDLETGASAFRLANGTNGGSILQNIADQEDANLTAMFDNINMLKTWVAKSGNGMFVQGDEVFAPSAPDGQYCDVFVDKKGAGIALMSILVAWDVYNLPKTGADAMVSLINMLLGNLLGDYLPENSKVNLPRMAYLALLYDFLYTQSREIAFNCIPLG